MKLLAIFLTTFMFLFAAQMNAVEEEAVPIPTLIGEQDFVQYIPPRFVGTLVPVVIDDEGKATKEDSDYKIIISATSVEVPALETFEMSGTRISRIGDVNGYSIALDQGQCWLIIVPTEIKGVWMTQFIIYGTALTPAPMKKVIVPTHVPTMEEFEKEGEKLAEEAATEKAAKEEKESVEK